MNKRLNKISFFIVLNFLLGNSTPTQNVSVVCKSDVSATNDSNTICDSENKKIDISTELGNCDYSTFHIDNISDLKWANVGAFLKNCEDTKFLFSDSIIIEILDNLENSNDKLIVNTQEELKNKGRNIVKNFDGIGQPPTPIPNPMPPKGYPYVDLGGVPYNNLKQKDAIILAPPGSGLEELHVIGKGKVDGSNGSNVIVVADKLNKLTIDVSGYDGNDGEVPQTYLAKAAMKFVGLYEAGEKYLQDIHSKIAENYFKNRTKEVDRITDPKMTDGEINDYKSSGLNCSDTRGEVQLDNPLITDDNSQNLPTDMSVSAQVQEQTKRTMCIRDPEFNVTQDCQAEKEYAFQAICQVEPETRNLYVYKREPIVWKRAICGTSLDNQMKKSIRRSAFVTVTTGNGKSYSGKISKLIKFDETRQFYRHITDKTAYHPTANNDVYGMQSRASVPQNSEFISPFWKQTEGVNILNLTSNDTTVASAAANQRGFNYIDDSNGSFLSYSVKEKALIPYLGLPPGDSEDYELNIDNKFPIKKDKNNDIKKFDTSGVVFISSNNTYFKTADDNPPLEVSNSSTDGSIKYGIKKIIFGEGYYLGIGAKSVINPYGLFYKNLGDKSWTQSVIKDSSSTYDSNINIPNLITSASMENNNKIKITTHKPHGLKTGNRIQISNTNFDGIYFVNQLTTNSFTIDNFLNVDSVKFYSDVNNYSFIKSYNSKIIKIKRQNNVITLVTELPNDYSFNDNLLLNVKIPYDISNGVYKVRSIDASKTVITFNSFGGDFDEVTLNSNSNYISSILVDSDHSNGCSFNSLNDAVYSKNDKMFIAVGDCGSMLKVKISNGVLTSKVIPYVDTNDAISNMVSSEYVKSVINIKTISIMSNDNNENLLYIGGENLFDVCKNFRCENVFNFGQNSVDIKSISASDSYHMIMGVASINSKNSIFKYKQGSYYNIYQNLVFLYNDSIESSVMKFKSCYISYSGNNTCPPSKSVDNSGWENLKTNNNSIINPEKVAYNDELNEFMFMGNDTNSTPKGFVFHFRPASKDSSYDFSYWEAPKYKFFDSKLEDIYVDDDYVTENKKIYLTNGSGYLNYSSYENLPDVTFKSIQGVSNITFISSNIVMTSPLYKDIFPWMKQSGTFKNCGILADYSESFSRDNLDDLGSLDSSFNSYFGEQGQRKRFGDDINDYDLGLDYFFSFNSNSIGISYDDLKSPGTQVYISNCSASVEIESIESSSVSYNNWYKQNNVSAPIECSSGNLIGVQSFTAYERDDSCYVDNPTSEENVPLWMIRKKCLEESICSLQYNAITDYSVSVTTKDSAFKVGDSQGVLLFPSAIDIKSASKDGDFVVIETNSSHYMEVSDKVKITGLYQGDNSLNGEFLVSEVPSVNQIKFRPSATLTNLTLSYANGKIQRYYNMELKKDYFIKQIRNQNAITWNKMSLYDMTGNNWDCLNDDSCKQYSNVTLYKGDYEETGSIYQNAKLFVEYLPDKDKVVANGKFDIEDYCIPTPELNGEEPNLNNSFYPLDKLFGNDNSKNLSQDRSTRKISRSIPIIDYSAVDGQRETSNKTKKICPTGVRLDKFVSTMRKTSCPNGTSTGKFISSWSSKIEDNNWLTYDKKDLKSQPKTELFSSKNIVVSKLSEIIDTRYDELPSKIYTPWTYEVDPKISMQPYKVDGDSQKPGTYTGKVFPEPYSYTDDSNNQVYFTKDKTLNGERKYKSWTRESSLMSKDGYVTELDKFIPFAGNSFSERGASWCNLNAYESINNTTVKSFGARNLYSSPGRHIYKFELKNIEKCKIKADENSCNGDVSCEWSGTSCEARNIEYLGLEIPDIKDSSGDGGYGVFGLKEKMYLSSNECNQFSGNEDTCKQKSYCSWSSGTCSNKYGKIKDTAFDMSTYPKIRGLTESCGSGEIFDDILGTCRKGGSGDDWWQPTKRIFQYSRYTSLDEIETKPYIINFVDDDFSGFNDLSKKDGLTFNNPMSSSNSGMDIEVKAYKNGLFRPLVRMINSNKENSSMRGGRKILKSEFLNRPETIDTPIAGVGQSLSRGNGVAATTNGICEKDYNRFRMLAFPVIKDLDGNRLTPKLNSYSDIFESYENFKDIAKSYGLVFIDLEIPEKCTETSNISGYIYLAKYDGTNISEFYKKDSSFLRNNEVKKNGNKIIIDITGNYGEDSLVLSIQNISATLINGKSMTNGFEKLKFVELSTPLERSNSLDSRNRYWANKFGSNNISGFNSFPYKLKTQPTDSSTSRTQRPNSCDVSYLKGGPLSESVLTISYKKKPDNNNTYTGYKWDQGVCSNFNDIDLSCTSWNSSIINSAFILKYGESKSSVSTPFNNTANPLIGNYESTIEPTIYVTGEGNNQILPYYYIKIMPYRNEGGTEKIDEQNVQYVKFSILSDNKSLFNNLYGDSEDNTDKTDTEEALSIFTKGDPTGMGSLNQTVKGLSQFTPWSHELVSSFGNGFGSWTKQDGSGQGMAPEPDCNDVFGNSTGSINLKPSTSPSELNGYFDDNSDASKYFVKDPNGKTIAKIAKDESLRKSDGCLRWDSVNASVCEIQGGSFLNTNGFMEFSKEDTRGSKWRKLYVETRERISQTCAEFESNSNNCAVITCERDSSNPLDSRLYMKYKKSNTFKFIPGTSNKIECDNSPNIVAGTIVNPARPNQYTVKCTPFDCSLPMTKVTEKAESSIVLSGRDGENGTNGGSAVVFCRDCSGTEMEYDSRGGFGGRPSYPISSKRSQSIFCGYSSVNPLNPSFFVRELWSQPFVGGASGIQGTSGKNGSSLKVYKDLTPEVIFELSDPDYWKK